MLLFVNRVAGPDEQKMPNNFKNAKQAEIRPIVGITWMSNGRSRLQCCYGTKLVFIANEYTYKFVNLQKYQLLLQKMPNKNTYNCLNQQNTGCDNTNMPHGIVFNYADKLALLAIILLLADVLPT